MTDPKIFDTADLSDAHAAGYDDAHHINSDDRLQVFLEHGGLTINRGDGRQVELSTDELKALVRSIIHTPAGSSLRLAMAPVGRAA